MIDWLGQDLLLLMEKTLETENPVEGQRQPTRKAGDRVRTLNCMGMALLIDRNTFGIHTSSIAFEPHRSTHSPLWHHLRP